jgi:hypothetical protein
MTTARREIDVVVHQVKVDFIPIPPSSRKREEMDTDGRSWLKGIMLASRDAGGREEHRENASM